MAILGRAGERKNLIWTASSVRAYKQHEGNEMKDGEGVRRKSFSFSTVHARGVRRKYVLLSAAIGK